MLLRDILVQNKIFTTEAQRTQRELFVSREIPGNKNILLQDSPYAGEPAYGGAKGDQGYFRLCALCAWFIVVKRFFSV